MASKKNSMMEKKIEYIKIISRKHLQQQKLTMSNANKVIGFWKPEGEYGFMSQWYPSPFVEEDVEFKNCEQYMMYQKAVVFGDFEMASKILKSDSPRQIKKLGRQVSGFDEYTWNAVKEEIIYNGNFLKFTWDKKLGEKLLETKNSILAEASPYDRIYGIGLRPNDPKVNDKTKWKGQNLLGEALMKVRGNL